MTLDEALSELDTCNHLKVSLTSVSASRWRRGFITTIEAHVHIRRKKGEPFPDMLIRAAARVASGHHPVRRAPIPKPTDRCACGRTSELAYDSLVKQRMCRSCRTAWARAAKSNDMPPVSGREVM